MHNSTAHHPLTDVHPIPEQVSVESSQLPLVYVLNMIFHFIEYPFDKFGSPGRAPSQLFVHLLDVRGQETE